jgi:rRNA maturation RNase YbeY
MIQFATEGLVFNLKQKNAVKAWIKDIITGENRESGDITYVFCSDNYLFDLNVKYLKHQTLTDIITFDYSADNKLSADIFISIDRVKANANDFKVTFESELGRVMAHGILHLVGYKDKELTAKLEMRGKEDQYLKSFPLLNK